MKQITNKLKEQGVGKKNQFISFMLLTFLMLTFQVNAQTTETFTTTGTFTVPAGVTTVQVEAWAGGGSGGGATGNPSGGGGGAGGNYVKSTSLSVPLSSYTVTVGLGANGTNGAGTTGNSSWFGTTGTILATGGLGGSSSSTNSSSAAGAIATTTGCVGATINKGGNGGTGASGATGGGGGSSASTVSALANSGGVTTGGAAPTGGGAGGNAGVTNGNGGAGNPGSFPGGGGGGGRSGSNSDRSGADGGDGQVKVTYTCPTYALTAATTSNGPLCGVTTSVVTLKSSSMGSGTYTVTYNLTGSTSATASTATMTFTAGSPGTGTFTTSSISVGTTTVTITKLTSAGCNNTISSNNTASIVVNSSATAVSGTNITTCSTTVGAVNITAGSSASNNTGILWTSNGTGTFTNPTSLTTCTYTPSPADIAAGSRTLTLTAIGNSPCFNATSNKTITINTPPTVEAGTAITTCSSAGAINITAGATATNQASVTWTRSGTGTLNNSSSLTNCTYAPSAADITAGTVTLTLTAVANSGCTNVLDTKVLTIISAATAVSGTAITTCSTAGAVNITAGSSATHNSGILWTSNGTGTFTNPTSLTTCTYTPSPADIAAGSRTLTLTATGNSPCVNGISSKTLSISIPPVTTTTTICQGDSGNLTSSTTCASNSPVNAGPTNAGTGANNNAIGSGTAAWTNFGNITTVGSPYATVANVNTSAITNYIQASNYNFAIPTNAVINGITLVINRQSSGVNSPFLRDNRVSLVKSGTIQTTNKAITGVNWPNNDTVGVALATATYGSISDLWGTTWTAADINNANFGVVLSAVNASTLNTRVATVDYMQISVNYTDPVTMNWYTVSSGGTSIGSGNSFNPVGIAGSGLADTNTPGTTTFYAACSTNTGCRTATDFVINPNITPTFTGVSPICAGGTLSALPLTSNNGITGTWSPALDNMATTTYTFTPDSGQCATTAQLTITVNPNITPTFTGVSPICTGGTLSALPLTSNNGITGTWSPALDNMATATYTFTPDSGQCATTSTLEIIVSPILTPTFTGVFPICAGGTLSALPLTSNNGITGTWSPALDNMVTTTYTFTPTVGECATSTTLEIIVNNNVLPLFDAVAPICTGTSLSALPTTSNNGIMGTWSPALNNTATTTYTFTPNPGRCSLTTTLEIVVDTNTTTYYADVDGDGYGDVASTVSVCSGQPSGYVLNNTDCLDTNAEVNPNHVEVLGNSIDDNCSGIADEVGPTAKVITSQCGITLVSLWNSIFSTTVATATAYRFEVSNGAFVRTFDTALNRFNLYSISGIAFGTTYSIRVSTKIGGFWQAYGTSCNITTPAGPPTTNVIPSQCGMTITNFWSSIFVNQVTEATGYLIELTDAVNGVRTFAPITAPLNRFNLRNFVGGGAANTVYTVRVAILYNGVYQQYGSPCTITTSAGAVRESAGLNSDVFAVNAYPNPFADNFKLAIETTIENGIEVKVYDMIGRQVEGYKVNASDLNALEVGANYPAGVYNVIVTQGENVKTLRVIKR